MKSDASGGQNGFTLVELLTVIAIIALLAALLLPVLNKGELSGKRAVCINDLAQIGLAFHSFSNDHSGKFPMAVSTNEGGTLEYVREGFASGSAFYTAFYHFQVLSNELVFPQMLVCPVDSRPAATNFSVLQNENLSYFVGVTATFDQPESILAGDRNIATNSFFQQTILRLGPGSSLWWTWEMHQQKGDVLFADGHVEQWNDSSFNSGGTVYSGVQSFFLPTVAQIPIQPSGGYAGSGASPGGSAGPASGSLTPTERYVGSARVPSDFNNPANAKSPIGESSATADVSGEADNGSDSPGGMSDFNSSLTKSLQHYVEWGYFWLWLLLMLYLAYRVWKWFQKRDARLREQMRH